MRGIDSRVEAEQVLGWRIHLFACRVLRGPTRSGQRQSNLATQLKRRVDMFNAGRWQELWAQVRYRPMRARGARSDPEVAAHVELLVRDGLYSKAAQALE